MYPLEVVENLNLMVLATMRDVQVELILFVLTQIMLIVIDAKLLIVPINIIIMRKINVYLI